MEMMQGTLPIFDVDPETERLKITEYKWNPTFSCDKKQEFVIKDFLDKCFTKDPRKRPDAIQLLDHELPRDTAPAEDIADLVEETQSYITT